MVTFYMTNLSSSIILQLHKLVNNLLEPHGKFTKSLRWKNYRYTQTSKSLIINVFELVKWVHEPNSPDSFQKQKNWVRKTFCIISSNTCSMVHLWATHDSTYIFNIYLRFGCPMANFEPLLREQPHPTHVNQCFLLIFNLKVTRNKVESLSPAKRLGTCFW